MTAPTPERRVGEAKRPRIEADRVEELADGEGIWIDALPDGIAPGIGNEPWDSREARDLALDLLDERAAVARLTAEVERLRGIALNLSAAWYYGGWKYETINEREMQSLMEQAGYWPTTEEQIIERRAALSLPTPAQEACQLSHEPNAETARAIEEAIYFPAATPKGGA